MQRILWPIRNCSHILLACTHYPAIAETIREFVSTDTVLVDPAAELAKRTNRWTLAADGADAFYASGDGAAMKGSAKHAFGCSIRAVEHAQVVSNA